MIISIRKLPPQTNYSIHANEHDFRIGAVSRNIGEGPQSDNLVEFHRQLSG